MTERSTGSERLRAATPIRVGAATLLVIERVVVRARRGGASAFASAAVEPYALVVREGGATRVIGVGAEEVGMERLRAQVPGIDRLLDAAARRPPPAP
jgi:hypothetical protein